MAPPHRPRDAAGARRPRLWAWVALTILLPVLAALAAGPVARHYALATLATKTRADARLRAALLDSEVARYRLLPLALAGDSNLAAGLRGTGAARDALNRQLEALARETGAASIYVLDRHGMAIAASNWRLPTSFIGRDYRFRRYAQDALRTGAGSQFALGTVSQQPGLYLARTARTGGVIVVKLDFGAIERQWRQAGGTTFVEDGAGIVLVTSRPDWRFRTTRPIAAPVAQRFRDELQSGAESLMPLPVPDRASLRVAVPTTVYDWRLQLEVPVRPVVAPFVRSVQIAVALAAVALVAIAWGLAAAVARRQELEAAVAARTADLLREIDERIASEARADLLREGLRQANRLATLGHVTASVAHETAQPVAAIRTYAETSRHLLDRGEGDTVRDNLRAIARLADRIGTVTAALRGFARKGAEPVAPILIADAIEGAQLILKERLSRARLILPSLPPGLQVIAARVGLEQVLVNLLQNAAEAIEGGAGTTIEIAVMAEPDRVRIEVRDDGPGIAPDLAARLFTPFVTSRPMGLGLGLVIAQDIAHDLGGTLRLLPSARGACFELVLRRAA